MTAGPRRIRKISSSKHCLIFVSSCAKRLSARGYNALWDISSTSYYRSHRPTCGALYLFIYSHARRMYGHTSFYLVTVFILILFTHIIYIYICDNICDFTFIVNAISQLECFFQVFFFSMYACTCTRFPRPCGILGIRHKIQYGPATPPARPVFDRCVLYFFF